ncbi:hypothetical protein [Haloferax sp. KTX1]|uniref:hypothetical protein n=1 Tax=Haloferax sp. KTX1 TaxID=2600597 RepID=UPI0011DDEDE4|nr:hypothetical protein [Haloferax sp. KTX1]
MVQEDPSGPGFGSAVGRETVDQDASQGQRDASSSNTGSDALEAMGYVDGAGGTDDGGSSLLTSTVKSMLWVGLGILAVAALLAVIFG